MTNEPLSSIRKFTARRRRGLLIHKAAAYSVTAIFIYTLISAALGLAFSAFPWTTLPAVWTASTILVFITLLSIPITLMIRRPSLIQTAGIIENKSGLKHPTLSLALELSQQNDAGGSDSLKEQVYSRAENELGAMRGIKFSFINKYLLTMAVILAFANAGIIAVSPNKMTSYWKLPIAMIAGEQIRVDPGSITVPLNSSVTLTLSGAARHFPTARLETWPVDGQNRGRHFLRADSAGNFSFSLDNIRESFVYQFSLSSSTPPETVTVVPPPLLRSLHVTTTPPRYTRLPPRELPAGQGNITAYAGTSVNISLESTPLNSAGIIINNKDTLRLDVKGKSAAGTFTVDKSAEYTFFLTDTLHQSSDSLPRFMISVIPDELPIARILKPGANKVLSTAQAETLWVEGVDDFGISRMDLMWRRSGEHPNDPPQNFDLSERGSPPLIRKPVAWNIRELSLYPGDTLYYWLWVRDNKPFGRAQTAQSDTFWFRVPSFEEIHKSIAHKEQYAQEKLGEVRNRQDDIRSAVDRLVRSATGSNELTWDQKRVVDDVKQQLQAQADSLQKAFEALEEGMNALREDGKLNEELFAKMEEIKKAVEELMKEFGENLFKMDTNQKMSMNDMRQAASKLRDMLPELSERLDQTMAFLEKIRQEKELADLALRAENLANEQTELAASDDNQKNDTRQKDLLDRIDNFNRDVGDFFKQRNENSPSSSQQVQKLSQEMKQQQGKSGDSKDGQQAQNKKNAMSRELMSLSEQLKSKLTVNMMAKMEEDRKRVLSMAHDALSLEEWQQLIRFQAQGKADDRSTAFSQQALGNALRMSLAKADSLTMVNSEVIRAIVNAYRNAASKSTAVVSSLGRSDGARQMDQSAEALRELANLLLTITGDDDDQEGGQGGSGGMMSGLRRASGRQAALNSMMGDLLQSLMGGRPQGQGYGQRGEQQGGQGQQPGEGEGSSGSRRPGGDATGGQGGERDAEARKQAREMQQAIADELKRLADAYGKDAGESMEKRVRELEQEARRLAQLLENPTADIIDQQDRFLSRMLQSTLSLNRKDEGKEERKGTASQTLFSDQGTKSPQQGASSQADSFHLLRKRAFEDNFPEEYRSAIREYFDALGEMKWGE
ncbi:MAG: DUF4175 domain-containing protein [Chitinispirillia bacterium]|nr:DUF4175 domain-containing protein [Chitinispirillia bacterium]MCL2267688.1 DUF4175 domain-containing protein [Chitinispirillia bacterium]